MSKQVLKLMVGDKELWMDTEAFAAQLKFQAMREELLLAHLHLGDAMTVEIEKGIYEKHGFNWQPPTCVCGSYVMTNHGLMWKEHGKYFKLLTSPEDIETKPFEGVVEVTRAVSTFDF